MIRAKANWMPAFITRGAGCTSNTSQEPKLPVTQTVREALRLGCAVMPKCRGTGNAGWDIETSDGEKRDAAIARRAELHEHIKDLGGFDVDRGPRNCCVARAAADGCGDWQPLIYERRCTTLLRGAAGLTGTADARTSRPDHLTPATSSGWKTACTSQPGALVLVTHDRLLLIASRRGFWKSIVDGSTPTKAIISARKAGRAARYRSQPRARTGDVCDESWTGLPRPSSPHHQVQKARIDCFNEAVAQKPGRPRTNPPSIGGSSCGSRPAAGSARPS